MAAVYQEVGQSYDIVLCCVGKTDLLDRKDSEGRVEEPEEVPPPRALSCCLQRAKDRTGLSNWSILPVPQAYMEVVHSYGTPLGGGGGGENLFMHSWLWIYMHA